eukprot:jgi/Ulvmu1/1038/UM104_0024.1
MTRHGCTARHSHRHHITGSQAGRCAQEQHVSYIMNWPLVLFQSSAGNFLVSRPTLGGQVKSVTKVHHPYAEWYVTLCLQPGDWRLAIRILVGGYDRILTIHSRAEEDRKGARALQRRH